jgi:hypothetical protein
MSRKTSSFTHNSPPRGAVHAGGKSIGRKSNGRKSIGRRTSHYLLGAALSLGLSVGFSATHFGTAEAYNLKLGDVDVTIDTTLSVGASWRTEDRNIGLISEGQGSDRKEMTQGYDPIAPLLGGNSLTDCGQKHMKPASALGIGNFCMYNQSFIKDFNDADGEALAEHYNYDRGINGDDGRLNFDNGDLTGGTVKATVETQASWKNVTAFTRFNAFYDAVMADDGSFERTALLDDADDELVSDLKVLDFYVDADFDVVGQPLLVRVGKQVINWGESTFILGGNSVFNPIDVPAFRRPGAEIKEALLPVNAVYASVALPYDLSLEAYIGEWQEYQLDAAGGPFAGSDAAVLGSDGNRNKFFSGTGAYAGSNRRNCDAHATAGHTIAGAAKTATRLAGELLNTMFGTCDGPTSIVNNADGIGVVTGGDTVDFRVRNPLGNVELGRRSYESKVVAGQANAGTTIGDTDFLTRGRDIEGDDENQGLALRWYAENLNSTEFGIYYQKGASRIPYVSGIARTPTVGISTTGIANSSTLRGAALSGCLSGFNATAGTFNRTRGGQNSAVDATFAAAGIPAGTIRAYTGQSQLEEVIVDDPTGLGERWEALLFDGGTNQTAVIAEAAANMHANLETVDSDPNSEGVQTSSPGVATLTAILGNIVTNAQALDEGSLARAQNLGCIAAFANSTGGSLLGNGATQLATRYKGELFLEYPEIETVGLSFATTAFGWGVQGEVAIRDEMPLQLDTDAVYIATIAASCAWENFANVADVYYTLQTIKTVCGQFDQKIQGYVTEEVITYNLGTTATFARSNPVISFLGADLGILLTEIGVQMADGIEEKYRTGGSDTRRLASLCTSGSDLPLGGVFSLDPRTEDQCRPTDESSGVVLFGSLQYNNVFGTPWGINPTLIHREGIDGKSPVAGGFVEGVKTTALSITGNYQANLSVSLGYTQYHGDVLYNANDDRDTTSLTVTYGF